MTSRQLGPAQSWTAEPAAAKLFNVEIFVQLFGVRYATQKQLVPVFHDRGKKFIYYWG
jgi:hypothetical protein